MQKCMEGGKKMQPSEILHKGCRVVRKHMLIEKIKVTLRTTRIQFKRNILDGNLAKICL